MDAPTECSSPQALAARDAFLLRLSDTLCPLRDPLSIQAAAAHCLGEYLAANRAFFGEIVDETDVAIHQDFASGLPSIAGCHAVDYLAGAAVANVRRGEIVTVTAAEDAASGMLAGIVKNGRWVAVLGVHSAAQRAWTPFEFALLHETAERTWSAAERARAALSEQDAALREVYHRVKNTLQLTASLIHLQADQVEDRRIVALFEELRHRVYSVATVYDSIHRSPGHATFDMVAYARSLAPDLLRAYDVEQRLQVVIEGAPAGLDLNRAVPFGLLLHELVSNVCQHAFPAGRTGAFAIRFGREDNLHVLHVADNGIGLPPGLDYERSDSLGLKLIRMLAQQLGGSMRVESGRGLQVQVRFPVTEDLKKEQR